jgi:hypothetical protein
MDPIEIGILRLATEKLVKDPHFKKKIDWWLRDGTHSAERWFQFEWAFQLQQVLKERDGNLLVICEKERKDVVICSPENQEQVVIEIKWYGNWCIDEKYHLLKAENDIEKVAKYPRRAVALIFLLVVPPYLDWLKEQSRKRYWVQSEKEFIERLTKSASREPLRCFPFAPSGEPPIWNLHLFAYYKPE